ncbi:MAG TPA: malto-oligosyltrehalose trehalohydrolase [Xanthobacteraceae bacterium]|jgi:malto-oligosyltrehalose trehalohydrolase|nr:malto-oligosyltrehalose trehalohydrolase [Xanthobacteraceae bacterium]
MTAAFARPLPFGATLMGADRTRFRLWGPAQRAVAVDVEGVGIVPMMRSDDGWFSAEAQCGAGARYRYRLDDGRLVPDPASRAQAGDVHSPSLVVDPKSYRWREAEWRGRPWHEAVIYELHAGALGGFRGVECELARLADLGVTAVELMPIAAFPGRRNWGYDGVLPFAPAASYGTPDDLKALIDAAHGHGLMMFLDVVYNHFGPDGNYLASYAPQFFRDDIATPWGPAIDFRHPAVRRFFTENALYWLMEFRFDGLRLDAAHAISPPEWLDEMTAEVRATVERGRHVHLVLEHDGNAASHLAGDFDAQWNDDGHHALHVLLSGEHDGYYADFADDPAGRLARVLAEGFAYQGEPSRYRGGKPRGTPSRHLPPTAFVLFLQNHDQIGNRALGERLTVLTDPAALEAALALVLLCPQIPLLFMGEEVASRSPFLFFTDHNEQLAKAVREGRQREFARFAGFYADRAGTLPDPNALETFERSIPKPDPARAKAREALCRKLLAIRRAELMPRLAGARALEATAIGPAAVLARWRLNDGAVLTLAANVGEAAVSVPTPAGRVLFESAAGAAKSLQAGGLAPRTTVALLESVS